MDTLELKNYRTKIFHDAADFNHPDRIPHLGSYVTWKIIDYGCKFSEALTDFDVMEKVVRNFAEKYRVDTLMDNGTRNMFNVSEAFGGDFYYYYDDVAEVVGVHPYSIVPIEELEEYTENPTKYLWTKALPRKFPDFGEKSLEVWQKTWDENMKFSAFGGKINKILVEEYGIPVLTSPQFGFIAPFIETMFNSIRGIKGLSIDLRRNYQKIKDACLKMDVTGVNATTQKIAASEPGHDYNTCMDLSLLMLVHTILNSKQFEDLYFTPTLKPFFDAIESKGKNLRITVEGAAARFFDYFKDYKPGTLCLLLEQDDIFESRKLLPSTCLIGGMPTTVLGMGSTEEVLTLAQKLCEEIPVDGGGYIFSADKFVSYRNDAKSENVKAVGEFIENFRCK